MIKSLLFTYIFLFSHVLFLVCCEGIHDSTNAVEGKIIGGRPAPIESFPFAILFFNLKALCSGVILNSVAVLTAAHCFSFNVDKQYMSVAINCRYIFDENSEKYKINNFVIHEDYSKVIPFEADIALIFVKGNFALGSRKQRALLMNNNDWMNGNYNITAIGWGWTKYGGGLSELGLLQTHLRFVSRRRCERLHNLPLSEDMFCLYGDGAKDTCRGDSGGGVTINGTVIGIVSHGDGCARKNKPSVYISVAHHRPWIERNILKFFKETCY